MRILHHTSSDNETIAESARWHAGEQMFYWIDVKNPYLFRCHAQTMAIESYALPSPLRCIDIDTHGNLMGIMDTALVQISIEKDAAKIYTIQSNLIHDPSVAFNDGRLDSDNHLWVGTMDITFAQPIGKLYRISPQGDITEMDAGFTTSNGMGWNIHKTQFYFIDSMSHTVYRYVYHRDNNTISQKEVFIQFEASQGYPDGLWVDKNDCIWIAGWGNHRVYQYSPEGILLDYIAFPAKNITSCCFGGRDGNTLFATSANFDLSGLDDVGENAGAVFVCDDVFEDANVI